MLHLLKSSFECVTRRWVEFFRPKHVVNSCMNESDKQLSDAYVFRVLLRSTQSGACQ